MISDKTGADPIQDPPPGQPPAVRTPARVVTFASGKGGVGKTSLLGNLALEMTGMGLRVLLVDANLGQANLDLLFNLTPRHGLDDFFAGRCAIEDVLTEGPQGVHLLPAGSASSPELSILTADQKRTFLQAMDVFHDRYDVVLVDTAAGIAENALTFCTAAEHLVVMTTPEPAALAQSHALLKALSRRYRERAFHILVNQANDDRDGARAYGQLVDLCDDLPGVSLFFLGLVPFDRCLSVALRRSKPVAQLFPGSPICRAQTVLAQRLAAIEGGCRPKGGLQFFWERFLSRGYRGCWPG